MWSLANRQFVARTAGAWYGRAERLGSQAGWRLRARQAAARRAVPASRQERPSWRAGAEAWARAGRPARQRLLRSWLLSGACAPEKALRDTLLRPRARIGRRGALAQKPGRERVGRRASACFRACCWVAPARPAGRRAARCAGCAPEAVFLALWRRRRAASGSAGAPVSAGACQCMQHAASGAAVHPVAWSALGENQSGGACEGAASWLRRQAGASRADRSTACTATKHNAAWFRHCRALVRHPTSCV